jgi:hypothetical protein
MSILLNEGILIASKRRDDIILNEMPHALSCSICSMVIRL